MTLTLNAIFFKSCANFVFNFRLNAPKPDKMGEDFFNFFLPTVKIHCVY